MIQELNEDDGSQFCEIMTEIALKYLNFLFNIRFSDKSSFYLNGTVNTSTTNRHNYRYRSDSNPRKFQQVHTQEPEKLKVYVGIFGDRVVGSFVHQ